MSEKSIVKTEPGCKPNPGDRPKGAKALNAYHVKLAASVEHYAAMEAEYRRMRKRASKGLADSLRACL